MKEQELQYYKNFINFLVKYEEASLKKGADHNAIALLSGETKVEIKEKLEKFVSSHTNLNSSIGI